MIQVHLQRLHRERSFHDSASIVHPPAPYGARVTAHIQHSESRASRAKVNLVAGSNFAVRTGYLPASRLHLFTPAGKLLRFIGNVLVRIGYRCRHAVFSWFGRLPDMIPKGQPSRNE